MARQDSPLLHLMGSTNRIYDARLFMTVLLGADLPDDPLLPELALLIRDHDTIVS